MTQKKIKRKSADGAKTQERKSTDGDKNTKEEKY